MKRKNLLVICLMTVFLFGTIFAVVGCTSEKKSGEAGVIENGSTYQSVLSNEDKEKIFYEISFNGDKSGVTDQVTISNGLAWPAVLKEDEKTGDYIITPFDENISDQVRIIFETYTIHPISNGDQIEIQENGKTIQTMTLIQSSK